MSVKARLEWKPQDLWIGVFWKQQEQQWTDDKQPADSWRLSVCQRLDVWICLLPCVPIHVLVQWDERMLSQQETDERLFEKE